MGMYRDASCIVFPLFSWEGWVGGGNSILGSMFASPYILAIAGEPISWVKGRVFEDVWLIHCVLHMYLHMHHK